MKTVPVIFSLAFFTALSGIAFVHAAGFNDSSPFIDAKSSRMERQDLSHLPVIHGFNQQNHHVMTIPDGARHGGATPVSTGAYCDSKTPRFGFQNSISIARC